MEKLRYPVLSFQLQENLWLGMLIGTDIQVIDENPLTIKNIITDHLQRKYKKQNDFPSLPPLQPELKIIETQVRPAFNDNSGVYPLPDFLRIQTPAVYGSTDDGQYECYLPLINGHFYYYDPEQLEPLAQFFCTKYFHHAEPEEIYRLATYPRPQMDLVTLKVNYDRKLNWHAFNWKRTYKTLNRLAEPYPPMKSARKKISVAPDVAWELDFYINTIVNKLSNSKANIVVLGPSGVGKSAALRQAVKRWLNHSKRQGLEVSCWRMMAERITASAKYLGEWEATSESLVQELMDANGALWIDNLARLGQVGGEGPEVSVAAFLTPFLEQQRIQIIGESTQREWDLLRRRLPAFTQCFHVVRMNELATDQLKKVLEEFAAFTLQNLRVQIEPDAVNTAYRLLHRYYPYESFPGKAIKLLGKCLSETLTTAASPMIVNTDHIINQFVLESGLSRAFLHDGTGLEHDALRHFFESRIIGQTEVIDRLCSLVKVFKAGMNNPYKPIATMLFSGPTGVGKTASAKALADYFFGEGRQKSPLIRFDMSEFQSPYHLSRLIGEGNEVGQLIKEVRDRPFSVVLFDEVEKAHPLIFDTLLTLFDEGMLTDFFGRVTYFRNTIIIMTSNLGATQRPMVSLGNVKQDASAYMTAIERFFRPEFVNRIDQILFFQPLSRESIRSIALRELQLLQKREGLVQRGIDLHFSTEIIDHLLQTGFDERYGARPLQRAIEQSIVNPLARWLLDRPNVKHCKLFLDYQAGLSITLQAP